MLKENGIEDIAISTDIEDYNYLGVEILKNKHDYIHDAHGEPKKSKNAWLNAYYPTKIPTCYLAGDVYWTNEAIKTLINTEVKETMFIVAPDWSDGRKNPSIKGKEPLGYIVQNQKVFRKAINDIMQEIDNGKFTFDPIGWNLYRKLNNLEMDYNGFGNDIFGTNGDYLVIDDLTTDIDLQKNIEDLERLIKIVKGGLKMVKVIVVEDFNLSMPKFSQLKNIQRTNRKNDGYLYKNDKFECTEEMAEYLTGKNNYNRAFVKILEFIPEKKETIETEVVETKIQEENEEKPKKRRRSVAKK